MSYDAWKTDVPEQDEEAVHCPVCSGEEDAEPCSEACAHIIDTMRATSEVRHIYEFCRRAMGLARQYRDEERVRGRASRRLEAVIQQVKNWREDVRHIRMAKRQRTAA